MSILGEMAKTFLGETPLQSLFDNISTGNENMGYDANPLLTDAVIAAVKTMNALDNSPTGIMGSDSDPTKDEIAQIDRLVHATNKDFLSHAGLSQRTLGTRERLDPATVVRFGLFANDWLIFLDEMKMIADLQALSAKRLVTYKKQAIAWAQEASRITGKNLGAKASGSEFSWKKFFVVTGILLACITGIVIFTKKKEDPELDEDLYPYDPRVGDLRVGDPRVGNPRAHDMFSPRPESGTVVINVQGGSSHEQLKPTRIEHLSQ